MARYDLECAKCNRVMIIYHDSKFPISVKRVACEFCGASSLKLLKFKESDEDELDEFRSQLNEISERITNLEDIVSDMTTTEEVPSFN